MLLTRDKHGRWAIFGYDLNRSEATGRGPDDLPLTYAAPARGAVRRVGILAVVLASPPW